MHVGEQCAYLGVVEDEVRHDDQIEACRAVEQLQKRADRLAPDVALHVKRHRITLIGFGEVR